MAKNWILWNLFGYETLGPFLSMLELENLKAKANPLSLNSNFVYIKNGIIFLIGWIFKLKCTIEKVLTLGQNCSKTTASN